jgi:hypothetical protein
MREVLRVKANEQNFANSWNSWNIIVGKHDRRRRVGSSAFDISNADD